MSNTKQLFDQVSTKCSRMTTRSYSTSFSLGIRFLNKELRNPIYAIYGFVRFADEIVDTFHEYDKKKLLEKFKQDTYQSIEEKISLNPILNSFQDTVNQYNIDLELIEIFLKSMDMDLHKQNYNENLYEEYILGSAQVVGLMCLKVFCNGEEEIYQQLKPNAMKLGSAFQKINFLRDIKDDYLGLGRVYFPGIEMQSFDEDAKKLIEADIEKDFRIGYEGIVNLPVNSRLGVYVAYIYYYSLFKKIKSTPSHKILMERIRIPNERKAALFVSSYIRHSFNLL